MKEITRTRRIGRSAAEVWATLADFGAIATWVPSVDHSSLLNDPEARPDHLGLVRRVQIGRRTLLERVVVWEEPTNLAYAITGLPKVVRSFANAWSLVPVDGGATEVTITSTLDCGPRPPQQLIAGLVGRTVGKESDGMLAGLADHLEARRG